MREAGPNPGQREERAAWQCPENAFSFLMGLVSWDLRPLPSPFNEGTAIAWVMTFVVMVCMSVNVGIKRLHDQDRSGWWYLCLVIPVVGFAAFMAIGITAGTVGTNQYGSDPLRRLISRDDERAAAA
jgi:uncharacterized membrane protein YhaH (DUF805 family)